MKYSPEENRRLSLLRNLDFIPYTPGFCIVIVSIAMRLLLNLQSVLKLDNSILTNEFWRNSSVTALPVSLEVTVGPASGERNEIGLPDFEQTHDGDLHFIPNPFNSDGRIVFERRGQNAQGDLTISNSQSVLLHRQSIPVHTGENTIGIDALKDVQAGVYWVSLVVDGKIHTIKVVK